MDMLRKVHYVLAISYLAVLLPLETAVCDNKGITTVSILADQASEDIQPGILHLEGHFSMQTRDWKLESTLATVYGKPDKPDKPDSVYLEGSPARFSFTRTRKPGRVLSRPLHRK